MPSSGGEKVGRHIQSHSPEAAAVSRAQRREKVLLVNRGIRARRHHKGIAGERLHLQDLRLEECAPDDAAVARAQGVDRAARRAVVARDGEIEQSVREHGRDAHVDRREATGEWRLPAHCPAGVKRVRARWVQSRRGIQHPIGKRRRGWAFHLPADRAITRPQCDQGKALAPVDCISDQGRFRRGGWLWMGSDGWRCVRQRTSSEQDNR